jgi:hypothetical protein
VTISVDLLFSIHRGGHIKINFLCAPQTCSRSELLFVCNYFMPKKKIGKDVAHTFSYALGGSQLEGV